MKVLQIAILGCLVLGSATGCGDDKALDWSEKTLQPRTAELGGWKVEWQIPDGLSKDEAASLENSLRLHATENEFSLPGFYLSKQEFGGPKSLAEAVSDAEEGGFKATKQEEREDGFFVVAQLEDKKGVAVERWIRADGAMVLCEAKQVADAGIPKPEKTIELLEKVCNSVTLPPEAAAPSPVHMKAFLSEFGSSHAQVKAALEKHGKPGLATQGMEDYDLTEPRLGDARKKNSLACFTFSAKAGMTTRSYEVCWEGDKIAEVTALGMR